MIKFICYQCRKVIDQPYNTVVDKLDNYNYCEDCYKEIYEKKDLNTTGVIN